MVKKILSCLVLAVTVITFTGCGGGGGGSSAIIPTSNVIRQVQSGEIVTYSVTGKLNAGTTSINASGTITMTTHTGTYPSVYGGRPINMVTEINVKASTGETLLMTSTFYYEQKSDGTVYEYGFASGGDSSILVSTDGNVPPIAYKSPVTIGDSYNYTGHYNDGSTDQNSSTVVLTEAINNQMSYKIHKVISNDGSSATTDEWLVPSWGYPIKMNLTIGDSDGTYVLTGILKSKNF